jgi:hypothetical protein
MSRFLRSWLSGKSFEESLLDAHATFASSKGELLNPKLLKAGDEIVGKAIASRSADVGLLRKLDAHVPTAEYHIVPREGLPPESLARAPRTPLPGKGPASTRVLTQQEYARFVDRLKPHTTGGRIPSTEFALEYRDLFPSRTADLNKTLYSRVTVEAVKSQNIRPTPELINSLRGGTPDVLKNRAIDLKSLRVSPRVGSGEDLPR